MISVDAIHAFSDNFIWLLTASESDAAVVVDPGDAAPVLERLQADQRRLTAILITHKHGDHVGGIQALLDNYPGIPVFGPAHEPIPGRTQALGDGDRITVPGIDANFRVMDVPGHTEGHIAYYRDEQGSPQLFCGDTLFSVGCGRVFSGTFEQLHDALMKLAELPDDTLAYCAHEYTLDNIGFAKWVEPDNEALLAYEECCHRLLDSGENTVPSTLGAEKAVNPFMRVREPEVRAAVEAHDGRRYADSRSLFRALRTWKDSEYD